jgi:hypothetical protein
MRDGACSHAYVFHVLSPRWKETFFDLHNWHEIGPLSPTLRGGEGKGEGEGTQIAASSSQLMSLSRHLTEG